MKKKIPHFVSHLTNTLTHWSFPVIVSCVCRSEVGEATGIFFVFIWDEENRLFKFVVAEFLKGDSCCDGGEDRNVYQGRKAAESEHIICESSPRAH